MPEADEASTPVGPASSEPRAAAPSEVRHLLLGRLGPYGDPRASVDALDDVEAWVAGLDVDGSVSLAAALVELATDADPEVATGAVLALDVVRRRHAGLAHRFALVASRMIDLVLAEDAALDRAPTGFRAASHPTLRAELAAVASAFASPEVAPAATELIDRAPELGLARVDLVAALAEPMPALVVARARSWVGPADSAVVARLRAHHQRIAVATAVRPWDDQAIRAVEQAGSWQRWHEAEVAAVLRVMRDEAPELTAPSGVGEVDLSGRWWIQAERPWDWTLWRGDDGRAVIERVEGTVGLWTSVRDITADHATAIVDAVVSGRDLTGHQVVQSPLPSP